MSLQKMKIAIAFHPSPQHSCCCSLSRAIEFGAAGIEHEAFFYFVEVMDLWR
jgi:hypothetical protein